MKLFTLRYSSKLNCKMLFQQTLPKPKLPFSIIHETYFIVTFLFHEIVLSVTVGMQQFGKL